MAFALAVALGGCNDLAQRHLGGLRPDDSGDAPKPAPALAIATPPVNGRVPVEENTQRAAYLPAHDGANPPPGSNPLEPNWQPMQHPLRVLYQRAAQTYAGMDSYIFRLRRSETVNGKKLPEEIIRVELRQMPYSVHLKWLGERNKGREVIYVQGRYDNKMQVHLAANELFAALAGRRQSIAPDDSMVKSESRYSITETGFGSLINRFGQLVAALEQGDPRAGTVKYLGPLKSKREDLPNAELESAHQIIPAKSDPLLSGGGQRWWYFDANNGLPVLIVTKDANDQVVEYYCHDYVQWPVRLDDDDFNPEKQWRK